MILDIDWEDDSLNVKMKEAYNRLFKQAITEGLRLCGREFEDQAEVSLILVGDPRIRALNKDYRGVDAPTDVLSFALLEEGEGEPVAAFADQMLGDIVISVPRARAQAEECGHSLEREMAYLAVHGLLHLLGFAHDKKADKEKMRRKEEEVMAKMELRRTEEPESSLEPELRQKLIRQALLACKKAYAPYSQYPVGAAALFSSGRIYGGCNVENASYGLTVCAERNAIFQGIARGERELIAIVIAVPEDTFPAPCGACRQVIREFSADCPVILVNGKAQIRQTSLRELLPEAFGPEFLES